MLSLVVAFAVFHFAYGQVIPLSAADQKAFVDAHNNYRKNEKAAAMQRMRWNKDLQAFAEKVAARCASHSSREERANLGGFSKVGENLYMGPKPTPQQAVDLWFSEKVNYTLATATCKKDAACGHYTQVVWATSSDIGCGYAKCDTKVWVACNYGPAGNIGKLLPDGQIAVPAPYQPAGKTAPGSACSTNGKKADADGLCV